MDVTEIYLNELRKKHRLLTRHEEYQLAEQAQRGDAAARETLILSVMPLAAHLAKKYLGRGLDLDDLIQAANEGVLKAVEKFDPGRGCRLTTYATWWIKQSIRYELEMRASLIHVPLWLFTGQKKEKLPLAERKQFRRLQNAPASLDAPLGNSDEDYDTLGTVLASRDHDLDEVIDRNDRASELHQFIDRLPKRMQRLLRLRLAGQTLMEIGDELGISRERVRQIETDAKDRLWRMYRRAGKQERSES